MLPESISLWVVTSELQGPLCPPDSGVAVYFQILLSLLCTYKHHPIPFLLPQGSVYLWAVSAVGCVAVWCSCTWGSFQLVMESERTGAGWQQAESMPLDFLGVGLCTSHISHGRVGVVGQWNSVLWFSGVNANPLPFVLHSGLVTYWTTEHLSLSATDLCIKKMQHKDVLSVLLRRAVSLRS